MIGMRITYSDTSGLADALAQAGEIAARTLIFDVEPLVASWGSGPEDLDRGVALVVQHAVLRPSLHVVCFATNSPRRPLPVSGPANLRVVYVASAGKPLRTAPYRHFPRPGMIIGDQVATDGALAWRLGYSFLRYRPARMPPGPRLMSWCGAIVRPLIFLPHN